MTGIQIIIIFLLKISLSLYNISVYEHGLKSPFFMLILKICEPWFVVKLSEDGVPEKRIENM